MTEKGRNNVLDEKSLPTLSQQERKERERDDAERRKEKNRGRGREVRRGMWNTSMTNSPCVITSSKIVKDT